LHVGHFAIAELQIRNSEKSRATPPPTSKGTAMLKRDPCLQRFFEAYLEMARVAHYRPAAPGDGCGGVYLTLAESQDAERLADEAIKYAIDFLIEENKRDFLIGCSDFETNKAFAWTIEAARQLASGSGGNTTAITLLKMAAAEVERVQKRQRAKL
jgi:hypothetical protein